MPDEHKFDTVMRFVAKTGDVLAECALEISPADKDFMEGFRAATYKAYSNFFQVSTFDFGFEVTDKDSSSPQGAHGKTDTKPKVGRVEGAFASWRNAEETDATKVVLKLEFKEFGFTRLIDAASPVFFKHCCDSLSFKSATMVKRLSIGGDDKDSVPQGFLRMDFEDVLITSLDWDDGEMTEEKCKFICKNYALLYRQQKPDGSWGAGASATWDYLDNALPESQQASRSGRGSGRG